MASVMEGEGEGLENPGGAGDAAVSMSAFSRPVTAGVSARGGFPSQIMVIREIYDSENANEVFEQQLEQALANESGVIVIEPYKLGDETARWISVGNCLHKTAVLSGFGSIIAAYVWPDKPFIFVPLTVLSTLCTGLYTMSWQYDPCCKYQVETDARQLAQLSLHTLNSSSPVVLVRKDDHRRRVLHSAVTIACLAQSGLRFYFPFLNEMFGRTTRALGIQQASVSSISAGTGRLVVSEVPNLESTRGVPTANSSSFMSSIGVGFNNNML